MAVRIVTDSACDLADADASALGISIVPLTIRFGADEFVDREQLSVDEFYRRLASSPTLPETSAPSVGAFEQAFRKAAADGAEDVVCIDISSGLSATMQSAQNAATAVADTVTVHVVDSRSVSLGLGSVVLQAARAASDGASAADVVALVNDLVPRTRVYAALDTLEYLKKGGRIGNAQALLGTMLSIKPLVDLSSGVTEEAGKARTRKKALAWLAGKVLEQPKLSELWVMHSQAPDVDEFLDLLDGTYARDEVNVGIIGATIGTHAGPGVMGVGFQVPA